MLHLLKFFPTIAVLFMLTAVPTLAASSATATIQSGLQNTATAAGFDKQETSLPALIGKVIQALLGIVGLIFLVLTVYAGILYMTDAGGGKRVETAKKILTASIIGLVIVIASYAFTNFVVTELSNASAIAKP